MSASLELSDIDVDTPWAHVAGALRAAGVTDAAGDARALVAALGHDEAALASAVAHRVEGRPLGLILGRTTFCGVELEVPEGTLAPRAETELLARTAIETLRSEMSLRNETARLDKASEGGLVVVDMCCGVGNVALALASAIPAATVTAADLTDACVRAAAHNVARLGLQARVRVRQGDLFAALAGDDLAGRVDAVVCNPPYISTARLVGGDRAPLLGHEPREAFDAGPYGLAIHQRVVREAPAVLRPGGWLLFEFGEGQAKQVTMLFERTRRYRPVRLIRDAGGVARVALAQLKDTESNP